MQPNRFKTIHFIFLIVSILFAFSLGLISGNYLGLSSRTSIIDHLQKGINENQLRSLIRFGMSSTPSSSINPLTMSN